jgi:hypothetical protein
MIGWKMPGPESSGAGWEHLNASVLPKYKKPAQLKVALVGLKADYLIPD